MKKRKNPLKPPQKAKGKRKKITTKNPPGGRKPKRK